MRSLFKNNYQMVNKIKKFNFNSIKLRILYLLNIKIKIFWKIFKTERILKTKIKQILTFLIDIKLKKYA